MDQPNKWYYSSDATRNHDLSLRNTDCIELIEAIAKKEGCKKPPFNSTDIALNLDQVEINKRKAQRDPTMDIAVGIRKNSTREILRMLLIEFRFNYKTPDNIDVSDWERKISYSKTLIGSEPQIHDQYFFIFQPNIVSQTINKVARLYNNNPKFTKSRVVCDVEALHHIYF